MGIIHLITIKPFMTTNDSFPHKNTTQHSGICIGKNQISMNKSFHVIFCHPMDHYKFMRNIKQHLSLLLDEPAEKQMIRNLPHRFSSLYSFSFSRFSISLAISLIPTRTQIYVILFLPLPTVH